MAEIIQSFSHLFLKLFRVQILENLGFLGPASAKAEADRRTHHLRSLSEPETD
jgi:hypothetical protein